MEASTAPPTTGSKTIADLFPRAGEQYADRTFAKVKSDGEWRDVSYPEIAGAISEVGRGLIDLGVQNKDRVAVLANTRVEWTYVGSGISAAGGAVIPVYPTNSPSECRWVVSDSEAVVVICEDASQVAKIAEVRADLPSLKHIVVIDEGGLNADPAHPDAISLDALRERGRARSEDELRERYEGVQPEDLYTLIYTSGTTGNPKGVVLTHGNYRSMLDQVSESDALVIGSDDVLYLFLPLAHAFAVLMQMVAVDRGACVAFNAAGPKQIVPELSEVQPTILPSVPRIFEKIYTTISAQAPPEMLAKAVAVGVKVRDLQVAGQEVPAELQQGFDQADEMLFSKVRAIFGGRMRECISGAAPISNEILEFFWAAGVPVLEGFGMTETSTAATLSTVKEHNFGSVGKALPRVELKIADDGELLLRGPNIFTAYWKNPDATADTLIDGWLYTGDLGRIDDDGYLFITGRKKDIIITAGGKNLAPANMEGDLKLSRWISQAVMHGDRRPFPVALITLDPEEILPWAKENGKSDDLAALAADDDVRAMIQEAVDEANKNHAQVGQIKKFAILEADLSQETGELTPTMKVKRNVVNEKYADVLEGLYS